MADWIQYGALGLLGAMLAAHARLLAVVAGRITGAFDRLASSTERLAQELAAERSEARMRHERMMGVLERKAGRAHARHQA